MDKIASAENDVKSARQLLENAEKNLSEAKKEIEKKNKPPFKNPFKIGWYKISGGTNFYKSLVWVYKINTNSIEYWELMNYFDDGSPINNEETFEDCETDFEDFDIFEDATITPLNKPNQKKFLDTVKKFLEGKIPKN